MVTTVAITADMAIITAAHPYIWDVAVVVAHMAEDILADAAPAGVADMAVPVVGAVDVAPAEDPVVAEAMVDRAAEAVTVAAVDTDLMAGPLRGQPFLSVLSRT